MDGRPALVVGGGRIAARKVASLLAAGAAVTVVAPEVGPGIVGSGAAVERRRYRRGEVARYRLAVAATGIPHVDRLVFEDGERAGVFVNAADDPAGCSFFLPAVSRRGTVTIAVSTGGSSPALAAWLRSRIEQLIGPEVERAAELLGAARDDIRARGLPTEGLDWDSLIEELMAPAPAADAVARFLEAAGVPR